MIGTTGYAARDANREWTFQQHNRSIENGKTVILLVTNQVLLSLARSGAVLQT
jgi:dolichyl-phosphate-mannose--protein O-mannosyl transferase